MVDHPLRRGHGRWLFPLAIALCLGLNIAALTLPFMTVDGPFSDQESFGLPRTVSLLWDSGLMALAVLVALFSVAFPLAKLMGLAALWLGWPVRSQRGMRAGADLLERLGRWSLLDVFLIAILLALTNDRLLVTTTPAVGVVCFLLSVCGAMACSSWAVDRLGADGGSAASHLPDGRVQASLLAFAYGALLAVGLLAPLIRVDDWAMRSGDFSIFQFSWSLYQAGAIGTAIALALFVIAIPLLMLGVVVAVALRGPQSGWARVLLRRGGPWAMIDVFVLAYAVFAIEGSDLVATEIRYGIVFLGLAALVLAFIRWRWSSASD